MPMIVTSVFQHDVCVSFLRFSRLRLHIHFPCKTSLQSHLRVQSLSVQILVSLSLSLVEGKTNRKTNCVFFFRLSFHVLLNVNTDIAGDKASVGLGKTLQESLGLIVSRLKTGQSRR